MRTLEEIENEFTMNGTHKIWMISYEEYKTYNMEFPKSRSRIIYDIPCCSCGKLFKRNVKSLKRSKKYSDFLFCSSKCSSAVICKTDEWKNTNSIAQLKIQGTKEQKEKNRQGVLRSRQNEENYIKWITGVRKNAQSEVWRENLSKALKRRWKNPVERDKMLNNGRFYTAIHGDFFSKFSGKIRYESSYELLFLFFCDLKNKKVERFDIPIEYTVDKIKHKYYPDFNVEGDIIEIKSKAIISKKENGNLIFEEKNKAAEKFVKNSDIYNSYKIYMETELEDFCGCKMKARDYIFTWLKKDGYIENAYGGSSLLKSSDYKEEYKNHNFNEAKENYLKWISLK